MHWQHGPHPSPLGWDGTVVDGDCQLVRVRVRVELTRTWEVSKSSF